MTREPAGQTRPTTDDDHDNDVRASLHARLARLVSLDFERVPDDQGSSGAAQDDQPPEPPGFSFRLFAASSASAAASASQGPASRVVLTTVDEDKVAASEGSIVARRPLSAYVRGPLGEEEQRRVRQSAVSGAQVVRRSRERAWGLEVPWRVVDVGVSCPAQQRLLDQAGGKPSAARPPGREIKAKRTTRPGKKTRIARRIKDKARKEKEAADARMMLTKEEHLKEKKKRLNRERKVKRRQKEREKKVASGGGGGCASQHSIG